MTSWTLTATGTDGTVTFDGVNMMISPGAKSGLMKAGRLAAMAYRRPAVLLLELDGPKREMLSRALESEKELLSVLLRSIRADNDAVRDDPDIDPDAPKAEALLAAFRSNRKSVVAAVGNHKSEIAQALRRNRSVAGLLLCTFIPVDQVERVLVTDDSLIVIGGGSRHEVHFDADHASEFAALAAALEE